jgi:shikimate kinase
MSGAMDGVRHVVLVGLMGSGKTTIGRVLAERLALPFRDSDAGIEERTGRTARDLQAELGDDAMHAVEADELVASLARRGRSVIAAAASTIESKACREALARPEIAVIWLRGSPTLLARRFDSSRHRPSFGADVEAFLGEQARRRDRLFASISSLKVDIDGKSPDDIVHAIQEFLTGEPRS